MSAALSNLPTEVRELIKPHAEQSDAVLSTIGVQIAAKRDEAKAARTSSGIEALWMEAEEAYIGIDDANRHEFSEARWAKPMALEGPVTTSKPPRGMEHKSTVYLRLTSRYVDAGSAKLSEILLPADGKAFSFSEMPVPELIEAKEDESQVVHHETGVTLTRPPRPGEPAPQDAQGAPQRVPLLVKDLALEKIEMARKSATAAETRIYDWMIQCKYRAEVRKVIADAARIGVGVLKGPVPSVKKVMAVKTIDADSGFKVFFKEKINPATSWVDPWNIFPDPACGESICDGDYVFERDYMSARQVRNLMALPGYIKSQIEKVLEEGPDKSNQDGSQGERGPGGFKNKGRFQVWYFYGTLTKDEMAAIDAASGREKPSLTEDAEEAHAIVTLINDSVVRATINPLDSGAFPYHSMPWQRRSQHWAGVGVAEQMKAPQRITNAALRAMLNNAGKAAGAQFVIDQRALRPADGNWTITPDKIWLATLDGPQDMRQSMVAILIPNIIESMMAIIHEGERFAEETTSIPLISQGQSGATTPDTFGAAQLQNNNANQLLRAIGYAFDDYITEPLVRQYYEWLLLDPDVPNVEKAEFQIDAHGSGALVERAIQDQFLAQIAGMVADPRYGGDPKKYFKELLRSHKIHPDTITYSEEEQQKIDQAPPPEAPAITVAKIGADVELKKLVASQTADQQTVAAEERIAAGAAALEEGKLNVDSTIALHEMQMSHEQALNKIKAELAKTVMQLQTERELNLQNNAATSRRHHIDKSVEIHKHRNPSPKPPVQAPGRAGNGQAFSQAVQ